MILTVLALALCLSAAAETPADQPTRAYPVSSERAVHIDSDGVTTLLFYADGVPEPWPCYVVHGPVARIRFELGATDNAAAMRYDSRDASVPVMDLLGPEGRENLYEQVVEGGSDGELLHYSYGTLTDEASDRGISFLLLSDEAYIDEAVAFLTRSGYEGIRWEYAKADEAAADGTEEPLQAYIVHVVDQNFDPVPGVYANFCTDTLCTMTQADENGTITFTGAPDNYHMQLFRVPAGYSFDRGFELNIGDTYGEWVLYIRKD